MWQIKEGRFEVKRDSTGATILTGNIDQFSTQTMEPASPTMVVLTRSAGIDNENNTTGIEQTISNAMPNTLTASPNPFNEELTVDFTLAKAQLITMQLSDMHGKVVYNNTTGYETGKHTEKLHLSVPAGVYTLSIKGKTVNLNTLVVCKP